jgi:hypothetical protein
MLTMQARRLLALLENRKYHWVSKGEMEGIGIRRHRDRVRELRALGYVIENRCARKRGPKLSEYRLLGRRTPFAAAQGKQEGAHPSAVLRAGAGAPLQSGVQPPHSIPGAARSAGSGQASSAPTRGRQGESDAVQASKET